MQRDSLNAGCMIDVEMKTLEGAISDTQHCEIVRIVERSDAKTDCGEPSRPLPDERFLWVWLRRDPSSWVARVAHPSALEGPHGHWLSVVLLS